MPTMPALKQVPSPNYSPTLISHDLVIIHDMEGGYEGSVNWLCRRATNASAHLCMKADGSEVTQLVPLQYKAWAQCAFNSKGVSLEMEGFSAKGFSDDTLKAAAKIVAWLLQTYGIPCQHAKGGQGRGFCSHHDLGQAGGGHHDFCEVDSATWQKFEGFVKEAYAAFEGQPLPAWALHGAPAPHSVALPPDVPPEPSHGGANRQGTHNVPLPAPPPDGSVADLQARLNKAGAQPALVIDGHAGALTIAALKAFQAAHGLTPDGKLGPKTWAALNATSN